MAGFFSEREEEIMRKRAISWALTASMVLSMLSGFIPGQKAYAADSSKKTGKTVDQDLQKKHYCMADRKSVV